MAQTSLEKEARIVLATSSFFTHIFYPNKTKMQPTQNFRLSIKKFAFSLTLISGLTLNLTSEIALAGVATQSREISRIEWKNGEAMNCNNKGIESLTVGSNMQLTFYNLTVACLNSDEEKQADWVILGQISLLDNNGRENVFLQRFEPETENSGARPNLYSFAKFVIGYNCSLNERWECENYSSSIENNVLKTFGSQQLKLTNDLIPSGFNNLESSAYSTTNSR